MGPRALAPNAQQVTQCQARCRLNSAVFANEPALLVVVVLTVANLNTLPRQYDVLLRFGADASWSEAIYSLDEYLESEHPRHVVALQWGVFTQLWLLPEDRLPVREAP